MSYNLCQRKKYNVDFLEYAILFEHQELMMYTIVYNGLVVKIANLNKGKAYLLRREKNSLKFYTSKNYKYKLPILQVTG
jgi:hypothetical protein